MKATSKTAGSLLALAVSLFGCNYQKPDYVQMVSVTDLKKLMEHQDVFLVDVHTPEQRHIRGTDLFVPFNEIERYKDRFPQDKNTPIYLYCEGGPMGNSAARDLHELGYKNLINLEGGSHAWRAAGFAFD